MTKLEYDFLHGRSDDLKHNAYYNMFQSCMRRGWVSELDSKGFPVVTKKGREAINAYQVADNWKRVDVI